MNLPGLPSPYILLAAGVALVLSTFTGYMYGAKHERTAQIAERQAERLRMADASVKLIEATNAKVREIERESASRSADTSAEYQRKLKEKEHEKDRAVAAVRAGMRSMFVNVTPGSCTNDVPGPSPALGGRDGSGRAELSGAAAEFLIGEASRADKLAEQLTACQARVAQDFELCGSN